MQKVSGLHESTRLPSCSVGHIDSFGDDGSVTVTHSYHGSPVRAQTTVGLDIHGDLIGESVLLLFLDDDPRQPVITGLLSHNAADRKFSHVRSPNRSETILARDLDFSAANSISIRCGRSQILMDKFGKIVVKGCNILTRASARNRVKGGSVSLN